MAAKTLNDSRTGSAREGQARAADRGYEVIDGVFAPGEMTRLLAQLEAGGVARTRAGARHILGLPPVQELAADGRMLSIAARFVGPSPIAFRGTLFDKSRDANWLVVWHQDTALPLRTLIDSGEWGPWSLKAGVHYAHAPAWALEHVVALRVSLDDSLASNGPLRVLPDTHRGGVYDEAQVERLASTITPIDCTTKAGGVVVMRPLTIHASSKLQDDRPRRVLHIEYVRHVRLGPGMEIARV